MTHQSFFRGIARISAILLILSLFFFFISTEKGVAVVSGALLSSIFVMSSAWVIHTFSERESGTFVKIFFGAMGIRFLLTLAVFILLLKETKIDEIYFTVSFIISYLCQSVTEMIFLNKLTR